jgi:hypothetical protein
MVTVVLDCAIETKVIGTAGPKTCVPLVLDYDRRHNV